MSVEGTAPDFTVTGTTVTLTDDETAPTGITLTTGIALTVAPDEVSSEGNSATTVRVTATLSGSVTLPGATTVTVQVGKSGDSATVDEDYADVADVTVTISAKSLTGTGMFELTPKQDTVSEGDETVSVEGTAPDFTVTGTTVTLTDDETAPTGITLTVSPDEVSEGNSATTVRVTATLGGSVALPSATTVAVEVGASGDSATEGTDYADVQEFTLTIPVGMAQGTATFDLTPMQDTVAEGDEEVSVEGTATGFTVTGTVVTLTDDDEAPARITLTVSPEEVSEGAGATTVTVTARLVGSVVLAEATTVTVEVGAPGDSATKGEDYAEVSSFTLEIPANTLTGTGMFELTPKQDTVSEGDETVSVEGTAPDFTVTGTTVTLTDDDTASTAITLTVSPDEVAEGNSATTVRVTATLGGSVALPAATTVTVEVGASGDSATEGTDYADVQEFTLTIPVGMAQGTATFELTPMQDTVAEGTRRCRWRARRPDSP